MRLLVVAPSLRDTSPGSRFRIEQWMPHLEANGVSCTYAAFEDERLHDVIYTRGNVLRKTGAMLACLGRRVRLLCDARAYDAVFLYEEAARVGPAVIERALHLLGLPIVYDFCDPVYLPYRSPTNPLLGRLKCVGKTRSLCRLADHVLVGNEDLASWARRFNPRVTVVPLTIDTALYAPKTSTTPEGAPPVVGWSGSHSTVPHLEELSPVLRELARRRRFRLEVVGAPDFRLPGVDLVARPWSVSTEAEDLRRFDIGIMPLPDDAWTRLRTHLKVRQYMGLGVPAVASPVGVNRDLVEDGVNGFLASTPSEWVEKLERLIDDPDLRRRVGVRGRERIEATCAAEPWSRRVLEILRELTRGRDAVRAGAPAERGAA